MMKGVLTTWFI